MPQCCPKAGKPVRRVSLFGLVFLILAGVAGQSQNPFDIHSRKLIDSTTATVQQSPKEVTDTLPADTTTHHLADTVQRGADSAGVMEDEIPATPSLPQVESSSRAAEDRGVLSGAASDDRFPAHSATDGTWWYYIFDLVLLLLLLGAFLYDRKIFPPLKKAFLHENFLRFLYRDTFLRKPGIFLYLNFIFLVCLGFTLFRLAQVFGLANDLKDYLIIQGVIILLFVIKHIALQLLTNLVDKPFEVRFYRYWMVLSAGLIGLWMIPVTLMISVLPSNYLMIALVISCLLLVLLLIYRQIKAMIQAKFFLSKHFFHFFLYFCAVEIVPVLILADILVNY